MEDIEDRPDEEIELAKRFLEGEPEEGDEIEEGDYVIAKDESRIVLFEFETSSEKPENPNIWSIDRVDAPIRWSEPERRVHDEIEERDI